MVSQPSYLEEIQVPPIGTLSVARNEFEPPADWPGPGPIELTRHDLPHASSSLEWWYVNCHLQLTDDTWVCVYAAFFRQLASKPSAGVTPEYAHSIAWGLRRPDQEWTHDYVAVDALAPRVGLANLDAGAKAGDPRVERALRAVLSRGRVPGPTRMLPDLPRIEADRLYLAYGDSRWQKLCDGQYRLELFDASSGHGCNLTFQLDKPASRYGKDGVVHGVSGERMFYYFVPRATVRGCVRLDGKPVEVRQGSGWYDHEFGVAASPKSSSDEASPNVEKETCWRWLSLQLDDGRELSVFFITRRDTGCILDRWTMITERNGETRAFNDTEVSTLEIWRSTRTFIEYPVVLQVRVPSAAVDLIAYATLDDQEVVSVISDPAFWEGTVRVEGSIGQEQVTGSGWLECKGFGHGNLDEFYASVGREVRRRLAEELPTRLDASGIHRLVSRGAPGGACSQRQPVQPEQLVDSLVAPIRTIADRGGKGWRSYAALACIDLVGGDSRKFLHWLAMPEIVHVGSLIVDDVEDESSIRRGGPACHELYGTARAINAGTAAYFLAEPPLDNDDLPPDTKLRIYRLYFDAMRAGHAGQALDLSDVSELVAMASASGDVTELERHVLETHRLKTAVPAAMFARVGALLGRGTDQQVEAVGDFFEAVGLAFQITDDVLNVTGFDNGLKEQGEDIRCGKITLPVVKAMARLEPGQRVWLCDVMKDEQREPSTVKAVCSLLEDCGALEECSHYGQLLVERAWHGLDAVVLDSQYKLMLRAFSWYVLERQY